MQAIVSVSPPIETAARTARSWLDDSMNALKATGTVSGQALVKR